jgi:hypothetical protein
MFWVGTHTEFSQPVFDAERKGVITYVAPQFRNHENFDLSFTALYDQTMDVKTFSAQRLEGSVQLAQRLSKPAASCTASATAGSKPMI